MWSLENLGRESLHAILFQTLNLAGFFKEGRLWAAVHKELSAGTPSLLDYPLT
jgi:hypothetical protein